jgi:hypothetical protein
MRKSFSFGSLFPRGKNLSFAICPHISLEWFMRVYRILPINSVVECNQKDPEFAIFQKLWVLITKEIF